MSTWYLIRREAVDPASDDAAIDRLGIQEMLEACARVMAAGDATPGEMAILRVPGGWLYSIWDTTKEEPISTTFVPEPAATAVALAALKQIAQRWFLVRMVGDVEPEIMGEHATYDELVEAARIIRHGDEQEFKDGLYCLSLYNGEPELEAFAGCELEPGNDG